MSKNTNNHSFERVLLPNIDNPDDATRAMIDGIMMTIAHGAVVGSYKILVQKTQNGIELSNEVIDVAVEELCLLICEAINRNSSLDTPKVNYIGFGFIQRFNTESIYHPIFGILSAEVTSKEADQLRKDVFTSSTNDRYEGTDVAEPGKTDTSQMATTIQGALNANMKNISCNKYTGLF